MSGADHLSVISALNSSDTVDGQIETLHAIKNHITGHELRKIDYIRAGLIPALSRLLQLGSGNPSTGTTPDGQYDTLWIHATNTLGSLAYGGPSFVQPVLYSTVITNLLTQLSTTSSPKLTLAILRCLNVIADNLPLSSPDDWTPDRRLANLLYTPQIVNCFVKFVSQTSHSIISQQTCDTALALVCKTCVHERSKTLLVKAGLLSALAERLATFVVAEGLVIPGLDAHGVDFRERGPVPHPAPPNAHLSPVLETIGLLTDASRTHAMQLINNSSIIAVLPSIADDFLPADIRKSPWGATYFSGGAVPRSRIQTPLDYLLPHVPEFDRRDASDNFPSLSTSVSLPKRRTSSIRPSSELQPGSVIDDQVEETEESLLVLWLLYIVRVYRGKRRILASRILVNVFKHGLLTPARAKSLKALVAPLIVQALEQKVTNDDDDQHLLLTKVPHTEVVPHVLAKLIVDDERLQKVAVDGKAITKLAACLKATFDPPGEKATLWRPWKQNQPTQAESIDCCLGPGGPSLQERHIMSYREGLLQALAAIAPFNDHYRKEICDHGVLVQIMLALEPFHSEATVQEGEDPSLVTSGNSASTLLAACDAVRALTRSVTALRTKLVDADIGRAIVKLMHSSDPEVTIAATRVVANLAIDFSPMKAAISEPALVKKLCEQAHSANARLRLESLWALKHLVLNSTNKVKRDVIDELGTSWIRHLIATDPFDIPPGEVIGLVEKEYPPRSAQYAGTGDVIMSDESDDEEPAAAEALRDKSEYTKHTVEDDLEIQEQLLDLLRNLFCGDLSSEIVDYILNEIGHAEFTRILMDRLKAKTTVGATRKANQTSSPPLSIVVATLQIIVHLAANHAKFRNMITGNIILLRQILTFHQSPDKNVRAAICWIAINLTYGDNPAEREACRTRALEMNRAGYLSHMKRMESDSELDVRERAKTAVVLLEKLVPKELQR